METDRWFDFADQVVVVTGAGGAIGKEISKAFGHHGAQLIAVDVDTAAAAQTADQTKSASHATVDISDGVAVEGFVSDVIEEHGRIDVIVNTAAIYVREAALDLSERDYDRTMDINVKGTWLMCQAAGRRMVERGYGRVINYTSNAGTRGSSLQLAYNASKAAVISMTKTLAIEWGRTGVTVNAVAPGPTDTPLMTPAFSDPSMIASFEQRIPQGALTPTDVTVGPVLFLASRSAGSITGHTLFADGGMSAM